MRAPLFNKQLYNMEIHCRVSPRKTYRPCGFTVKTSSRRHRHLIKIVKRNTKTDGMSPFKFYFPCKIQLNICKKLICFFKTIQVEYPNITNAILTLSEKANQILRTIIIEILLC